MHYVKLFWTALLLVAVWWRWRRSFWLASTAVVLYLLADDAMSLHERLRVYVPIRVPATFPIRENHVQELVFLLASAAVLLTLLAVAYARADAATRRVARRVVALFGLIAFCAVVVDLVHTLYHAGWYFEVVAVVEDGGEMVAASLLVVLVFTIATEVWAVPRATQEPTEPDLTTRRASPGR
jgi:hypothetical protein